MALSKKVQERILYSGLIILSLLYILSFFKHTDKRKSVKTSFLNPKYLEEVYQINLFTLDEDKALSLKKIDNIWFIEDKANNKSAYTGDQKRIEKFLNELSKIRTIYHVTDNLTKNNNFGLMDKESFHIKYYTSNSNTDLIFGNLDFSDLYRFFMTGKNTKIYQVDNNIELYLTTNPQIWQDPFLISPAIINLKEDSIQGLTVKRKDSYKRLNANSEEFNNLKKNLMELRHGGTGEKQDFLSEEFDEITVELGDKNSIEIKIYALEDSFQFITTYNLFNKNKKYETQATISNWTYRKLFENL